MKKINLIAQSISVVLLVQFAVFGWTATYYVANSGNDSMTKLEAQDINTPWKTIQKASGEAVPGDTIMIRGGEYNEILRPLNSGAAGNPITYKNYGDEDVLITNTPSLTGVPPGEDPDYNGDQMGIYMFGREYIVVDGLRFDNFRHGWARINRCRYITLQNNTFTRALSGGTRASVKLLDSDFCRVLNNTLHDGNDNLILVHSDNNLIEGNTITLGRHTIWCIRASSFNVVRNNYFHNDIQKIGEVYDNEHSDEPPVIYNATKHNIIERNIFAYTAPDDGDGPFNGIQYAGQEGIIRNNVFYDCHGTGIGMANYADEARYNLSNRIYNNVFYNNTGGGVVTGGANDPIHFADNIFKNNIFYKNTPMPIKWADNHLSATQISHHDMTNFLFDTNNIINISPGESDVIWDRYNHRISLTAAESQYASLYRNNIEIHPLFINENNHDFTLQQGSPMIDAGAFLTRTVGAGSGTSLPVEDVGYFYDGFDIYGETGDVIQLSGQIEIAVITDIDYANHVLILDRALSWSGGQGVTLSYTGSRPDLGAYEYGSVLPPQPPQPPEPPVLPEPPVEPEETPTRTEMQCYNNVFNPSQGEVATISVELDEQVGVSIVIYDNKGKEIKKLLDEEKQPGFYSIKWNGKDNSGNTIGSGIYMVHMKAGEYTETKKIAVVK